MFVDHPPIVGYRLIVRAPGPMTEPFGAFVHRYDNPEVPAVRLSSDRSRLVVEFDRVPTGDGVEVRYLMDPELFDAMGLVEALERLLEDEAGLARSAR